MDAAGIDSEADIIIRRLRAEGDGAILEEEGEVAGAAGPACGARSETVHGRYRRQVWELPWGGRLVRLLLTVRNFCCVNPACPRRTCAEPFAPLVGR